MDLPPASIQELNHQKLQNKSPKERKKKKKGESQLPAPHVDENIV